jgi:hypothetical protein
MDVVQVNDVGPGVERVYEIRALTVGAIGVDETPHAHLGGTFEQTLGDDSVCLGDATEAASDGKNAIVNAGDDLANARADSRLVAQICDVLASFANDHAGFLGGHNGSEGELLGRVLVFGADLVLAVTAIVGAQAVELSRQIASGVLGRVLLRGLGLGGHCEVCGHGWGVI